MISPTPLHTINDIELSDQIEYQLPHQLYDIRLIINVNDKAAGAAEAAKAAKLTIIFGLNRLIYSVQEETLCIGTEEIPLSLIRKESTAEFHIRLIIDKPLFELIGAGGTVHYTGPRLDQGCNLDRFVILCENTKVTIKSLIISEMLSV